MMHGRLVHAILRSALLSLTGIRRSVISGLAGQGVASRYARRGVFRSPDAQCRHQPLYARSTSACRTAPRLLSGASRVAGLAQVKWQSCCAAERRAV